MDELNEQEIQNFYEHVNTVWSSDKWHLVNQKEISRFIGRLHLPTDITILNAGSGGNDYGLSQSMYHLDIAKNKIEHLPNTMIGSIESIPAHNGQFDMVICVGSVLNYCDAAVAICEFQRVLKPEGSLVIEFETSWGLEYYGSKAHRQSAAVVQTSYFDQPHKMWVYSDQYISGLLRANSFVLEKKRRFHILSGLSYYFSKDENLAAKYAYLDTLLQHIPGLRSYASNIIISCNMASL